MPEVATTKAGWTAVAFGDVVRQVKDKVDPKEAGLGRYIAGQHMDTDDLRIRRWGVIGVDYLGPAFHMRFKPGHVLYGSRRTYLRKVALADFEGITANTTYVLESRDPDVLLPELLPFIMQSESFNAHSKRESKGSVNPYVNFSDLAWYEFSLPPLKEQRRIAEVLLSIEATNTKFLKVASSGDAALGSCRDTWFGISISSTSTLGRLCERGSGIQIGPFGAQLHQSDYRSEGVPVVMPSNLGDNSISTDQIATVSPDKADQLSQHRLHIGDIVLPRRGDLGRRALVSGEYEGWLCGTGCLRIRLDDVSLAQAVVQSLSSISVLRWMESRAVGTTMPNLNSKIVAGVPVHIPERVRDALELIDQLTAALESTHARIAKLTRTRSSLLVEVFQ